MNYYDIQQYANSADVIVERKQRNYEEDHMREVGLLPTYRKNIKPYEPSQSAEDAINVLYKQLFRNEVQNA